MKFRFVFLGPDGDPGRPEAMPIVEAASTALRYEAAPGGMVRREPGSRGEARFIPLANFVARIVSDRIIDDGSEAQREFGLCAEVAGQTIGFSVPAVEFGRMAWVLKNLGPEAIICPGQAQHARAAVQALSQVSVQADPHRTAFRCSCPNNWQGIRCDYPKKRSNCAAA